MKRPGMRIIKTAISVSICVLISRVFYREYIFYAAIASVIAMQGSVSTSFNTGKNRMLGTVVGAFIGLLFALISPQNVFLCGVGIVLIIYLCDALRWQKSVTISCIVFLAIMLNLNGRSPWIYSINRITDTFIGITVAVLVNYLIAPPKHIDAIKHEFVLTVDKAFNMVEDIVCKNKDVDLESLNKEISKFESAFKMYLSEFRIKKNQLVEIEKVKEMMGLCKDVYIHLNIIKSLDEKYTLNEFNYIRLTTLFNDEISYDKSISNMSVVFNYHVDEIIKKIYRIKEVGTI